MIGVYYYYSVGGSVNEGTYHVVDYLLGGEGRATLVYEYEADAVTVNNPQ